MAERDSLENHKSQFCRYTLKVGLGTSLMSSSNFFSLNIPLRWIEVEVEEANKYEDVADEDEADADNQKRHAVV